MSAEENKALVRRFVEEFWNEGNTIAVDELTRIIHERFRKLLRVHAMNVVPDAPTPDAGAPS